MNVRPLSVRSTEELIYLVGLATETSIGAALFDHGLNYEDLKADPVGHLLLSVMLKEEDRLEMAAWWQYYLETGVPNGNISRFKRLPDGC